MRGGHLTCPISHSWDLNLEGRTAQLCCSWARGPQMIVYMSHPGAY